jgi:hypothetical protein
MNEPKDTDCEPDQPSLSVLSPEEQMSVYRIARNFQDNPSKVVNLLKECVGNNRLQLAIEYLESVIKQ